MASKLARLFGPSSAKSFRFLNPHHNFGFKTECVRVMYKTICNWNSYIGFFSRLYHPGMFVAKTDTRQRASDKQTSANMSFYVSAADHIVLLSVL